MRIGSSPHLILAQQDIIIKSNLKVIEVLTVSAVVEKMIKIDLSGFQDLVLRR